MIDSGFSSVLSAFVTLFLVWPGPCSRGSAGTCAALCIEVGDPLLRLLLPCIGSTHSFFRGENYQFHLSLVIQWFHKVSDYVVRLAVQGI